MSRHSACEDGADPPSPDVEEMLSKLPGVQYYKALLKLCGIRYTKGRPESLDFRLFRPLLTDISSDFLRSRNCQDGLGNAAWFVCKHCIENTVCSGNRSYI